MRPARRSYSSPELVPTRSFIEHPYKRGQYLPVHRRPMRLPGIDYAAAECCCFVTYNLRPGNPPLSGSLGQTAWDAFLRRWREMGFTVHSACMMPDHVHILLNPTGKGETIGDIVARIKRSQYFSVRDDHGEHLAFQEGFWDHVLGRTQICGA
jgi:REP element-mobilizing transposase RayT